jgi:HAD superfamily hydrolase (TIGR01484 family)
MPKKVIAFDLDGTLAPSKSPLPDRISTLLDRLLEKYQVCVISGGKFGQFEKQLLNNLPAGPTALERLHIMPTCGTRYMKYDVVKETWETVYAEDFTEAEKKQIAEVLDEVAKSLGYEEKETYGEVIEDRGSQISWSALGQEIVDQLGEEGLRRKEAWDPDNVKKNAIRNAAAERLSGFEVRVGGLSTIDVTRPGIDKAYGMKKLCDQLGIEKESILFIGDRLSEGGNDYPVKEMGIDSLEIDDWQETALVIEALVLSA